MRKFLFIIGIIILLVIPFLAKTIWDAGEFKSLKPHFDGTVTQIGGLTGAEDITIDHQKRIAYISADDRFATLHGSKGFGGLYVLYLDSQDVRPRLLRRTPENEIHPHGISYYKSPEGQAYLYVVDHTGGKHAILLFRFTDDTSLELINRITDSTFIISPNDVIGVDEHRFYFTNDHGSRSAFGKTMEDYLRLKKSNVVYYNGERFNIAASKILYANGINISKDEREVYVSSTTRRSVLVYERDVSNGQLSPKTSIFLNSGADNIELDEHGNLWVACHPKLLTFIKHANDTNKLAPSQVFELKKDEQGNFNYKEIYLNSGEDLSASSVGAVDGNTMLVGPVLDDHILWCKMH